MSAFQEKVRDSVEKVRISVLTPSVFSLRKLSRKQSLDTRVDFRLCCNI